MGRPRDRDRREGDAGADGAARRVRPQPAAQGRPDHRLPAHDGRDGGPDPDAAPSRRQHSLELVQHLLDPGPGRGGDRRRGRPGVRLARRDRGGLRLVHPADDRGAGRLAAQHAARRRRRSDQDHARRLSRADEGRARPVGGDHHGRAPAVRDAKGRHAAGPRVQRQRFGDQVQVRQPLRRAREPGRRHQARHQRDDRGQDRGRGAATATSARARPNRCAARARA